MTSSSFSDKRSSSRFYNVVVFLLSSLVTGLSFMLISLLVLEFWQLFCKGLTRYPKIGNTTVLVLSNIWRLEWVRDPKFDSNVSREKLINATNFQVFSLCYFWVIKEKPRLALKCPEILKRVEAGNTNFQHKQIFVKYLCRVSSQILQTFKLTGCLEFSCRFSVL